MHGPETGSTPSRRPHEQSADALRRSSRAWRARLRPEAAGLVAFLILESRILNGKRQGQQVKDWRLCMRSRKWRRRTSGGMDEVVAEIVPNSQPTSPSEILKVLTAVSGSRRRASGNRPLGHGSSGDSERAHGKRRPLYWLSRASRRPDSGVKR